MRSLQLVLLTFVGLGLGKISSVYANDNKEDTTKTKDEKNEEDELLYDLSLSEADGGTTVIKEQASAKRGTGYSLWFGPSVGSIRLDATHNANELPKNGYYLGVKSAVSLYTQKTAIELAGGWYLSRVFSTEDPEVGEEEERELEIETHYGIAELAARYRAGAVEIGPLLQVSFGTDSSLSPDTDGPTDPNVNLGLQALWQIAPRTGFHTRFGGHLLMDVTSEGRDVFYIGMSMALGVPLVRPVTKIKTRIVTKQKIKEKTKLVKKVKYMPRYVLDAGFINFETNKYQIENHTAGYLKDLAAFLASHQDFWDFISIRSHTDKRGGVDLNRLLSRNRAKAILRLLRHEKISKKKYRVRSFSYSDPVEDSEAEIALARNRRTEIEIISFNRRILRLKKEIGKIRQRHRMPTTCHNSNCQ